MDLQLSGVLIKIIGISALLAIIGGFVFGIVCLIRLLLKIRKQPIAITYYVIMILSILTVAGSWIFNMGWYRVILTWLMLPFVHPFIFIVINAKALPNLVYSAKLRAYTLITYVTYLLTYVLFPDGGDVGAPYVFFGLINNGIALFISGVLSAVSFAAYVVFTVLQMTENAKVKKRLV